MNFKKTLAAALFAATAMAGTRASAIEPGFLSCTIVGSTVDTVFIEAFVDPSLDQQLATVSFAPLPECQMMVGCTILHAGANLIPVPNFPMDGTYVIDSNGRKSVADDEPGLN
jgi:hypothetical protein